MCSSKYFATGESGRVFGVRERKALRQLGVRVFNAGGGRIFAIPPSRRWDDGLVQKHVRALVDAEWRTRLGIDQSVLEDGGVHVVTADLGDNDAMSFLLDGTCIIVVPVHELDAAREALVGLDAESAFTADVLRTLVGPDAQVDGPSCHSYADERSFRGSPDSDAVSVDGRDAALLAFLEGNDVADWAESGFPQHPSSANPETTRFWLLREHGDVVAGANMTEWRGLPADVGVLTSPTERGRGLASRLVGAMVVAALPTVGVARYRALASNLASLAVARRLGFGLYGQNFRARRS